MSIASKLTYLNNTKQLLKDGINDLGGNIDSETTFREYVDALQDVYNDYPKVSDTGTEITLTNTKHGRLTTELNPTETSQESTTGKNLYNDNFADYTRPQDYRIFPITLEQGQQYTISAQLIGIAVTGCIVGIVPYGEKYSDFSGVMTNVIGTNGGSYRKVFTTDETFTSPKLIVYATTETIFNSLFENYHIQLELGNVSTPVYEPYTGGIPAPNPNYPFPIHTVSGENNIKIENKNLSNGINQNIYLVYECDRCGQLSGNSGLYIAVNGGYYTVSSTTNQTRYRVACIDNIPYETPQTAYNGINKDNTNDTIIINTTGHKYLVVNATDLSSIQIEQGSTASEYVPHQEQNYVINLGDLEYCKIGTYKDQIFENTLDSPYYDSTLNENEWYMKKNIGKVVLDGSETWYLALEGTNTNLYYNQRTQMSSDVLSDYFTRNENLYTEDVEGIRGLPNNNRILIRINKTIGSNVNAFKSWLTTHNTIVYYALNTSEYINITENYPTLATQLENLIKARSYDEQTNISQTNNDLPFDLNIKALMKGE